MSCIHLHLGQAGVQLGESFWGLAEEEFLVGDRDGGGIRGGRSGGGRGRGRVRMHPGGAAMFHEEGGWARCLAVDSEPKVSVASQHTGVITYRCGRSWHFLAVPTIYCTAARLSVPLHSSVVVCLSVFIKE